MQTFLVKSDIFVPFCFTVFNVLQLSVPLFLPHGVTIVLTNNLQATVQEIGAGISLTKTLLESSPLSAKRVL